MATDPYYDWVARRALSPDEGCTYDRWPQEFHSKSFAVHAGGFLVFLPPSRIRECDEYVRGDKYRVESALHQPFHQRRLEGTLDLLRQAGLGTMPGAKVLDLGCGQGHITARIREAFAQAELSGLDCSLSAIRSAAAKHAGIDFVVADAHLAPYRQEYFDLVVCNNVWEHVPDPLRLLASIRRIVKPGGRLLISTPSRYRLWNLLAVLRGRSVALTSEQHVTEYTVGQVAEQLRYGGFAVEAICGKLLPPGGRGLKAWIGHRILGPLIRACLAAVGSHHCLASTVFYLARKVARPPTRNDPGRTGLPAP